MKDQIRHGAKGALTSQSVFMAELEHFATKDQSLQAFAETT